MIQIKSLNKIYKSKKRRQCHALSDVNLTLGDKGLVFVLGKSGSGKSTLLNLIGGLDNVTSGSIEVDGNDLAKFKEKDFCNYRNTHIGFIFQDYHLIDELTVYENIVLSLNLRRIEDGDKVRAALEKVDLAGYEDRFPSELSGGEQQRVAIARAIVKKPRIILADEPTGNLDTNTATAVIKLLKELARDCLILIVSHNINDANNYADRIIELRKGKIISDKTRNPEFPEGIVLSGEEFVYPEGTTLSDRDIDLINGHFHTNSKMIKRTDKFLLTNEPKREAKKVKIENSSLKLSKKMSLSGKFLKNKALPISLSSFMVAVIMVIMALAQTIIAFDGSAIISSEMEKANQTALLLNKVLTDEVREQLEQNYRVKVDDGDIQAFYDAGYGGKIYPVLNYCVHISSMGVYYGTGGSMFHNGFYLASTFGTVIVDEDFLQSKFGDFEFAAEADVKVNYGVYITDYVADSLIDVSVQYKNKTYEDIVGAFSTSGYKSPRWYVNGIIKTNYKEKYEKLLENVKEGNFSASELYENTEYQAFYQDIYSRLGYTYSLNPDLADALELSGINMFPGHYQLNFNHTEDVFSTEIPTVSGFDRVDWRSNPNVIVSNWIHTKENPEIPIGAKYMRVAFNDGIDDFYKINTDVTMRECAMLRFDGGEPISAEVMNYQRGTEKKGLILNGYNGEVEEVDFGLQFTTVSDFIEIPEGAVIAEFASIIGQEDRRRISAYCVFYDENKDFLSSEIAWYGMEMSEGTVKLDYQTYNEVFGTEYDKTNLDTFVPHKAILSHYEYSDVNHENPLFMKEVTIVGLNDLTYSMDVSPDIRKLFAKDFIRPQALYFDGTEGIGAVLDTADGLNFEPQSFAIEGIHTMTKAVDVFVPIFELIAVILCVGVVFILMNFSSKMINDKMHEIGILKALGTKNHSIGVVFGLQVVLIALLTCILSTAGYYFFIDIANDVLIESLKRLAPSSIVLELDFLTFKPAVALVNCALVFALSLVSLIIPMIKIKAIKPVKIIKAKE